MDGLSRSTNGPSPPGNTGTLYKAQRQDDNATSPPSNTGGTTTTWILGLTHPHPSPRNPQRLQQSGVKLPDSETSLVDHQDVLPQWQQLPSGSPVTAGDYRQPELCHEVSDLDERLSAPLPVEPADADPVCSDTRTVSSDQGVSFSGVQPFSSRHIRSKTEPLYYGVTPTPHSKSVTDDTDTPPPSSIEADTVRLIPSRTYSPKADYQTFTGDSRVAMDSSEPKSDNGWSPYTSSTDIVKNETSSHQKHKSGNTGFVWFLSSFATIGGLLFGYDTGIVSGSMLLIQPYFDLSTVWQEAIVSGTIGAAAVFALMAGFVCDWIGRKKTIMIASFVFAVGAIVMAVAENKETLLGGRIIVGFGIGFASMTVPVYVAESAPPDIRGRLVTLNQLFITIGIVLSSIIAGAFSEMKETGWRYMLGIAAVPGIIQFLGFIYLPESPRWLVAHGKEEEARKVLQRIRGQEDVDEELLEVKEKESEDHSGFVLGQMLKTPHVRKALFVGCGLQLFQQLCGINTVIYYSATILKQAGFPPSQAIWLVCVPFGVNFLATFIGLWAVERLGRRLLLVISFLGVIVALIILAVGFLLSIKHSPSVNATITFQYSNGTLITDECSGFSVCEDCAANDKCGFCYDDNDAGMASCLLAFDDRDDKELYSDYGPCRKNYTALPSQNMQWTYGYCPTDYTWMAVLGLALFVLSFAPGLGPMPWTINSEIYPMWARGTGVSLATMFNWAFNLLVSFTFLTLLENITKYGTFFLFTGICVLGTLFTLIFVPETKDLTLEEVEELFMTAEKRQKSQEARMAAKEAMQMDAKNDPSNNRL